MVADRSAWSAGSATPTTVASMNVMPDARMVATRVHRLGDVIRHYRIAQRGDMRELEVLIGLILAAVILAAAARRIGAPYPVFLALGGAILAFIPGAPRFTVLPELALALFVSPVLLYWAYAALPRDLPDNWAPGTGLVVFAVGLTTVAVAVVARTLMPAMPWAPAIALGAVVAPPDAPAATAVLRQLRPPHRIRTILEGESLLNDAS